MKDQSINMKEIIYQAYYYLQGKQERLALQDAAAAVSSAKAKYRVELLEWMRDDNHHKHERESKAKARMDAFAKLQQAVKPRPSEPNLLRILETNYGQQRRLGTNILAFIKICITQVWRQD
jgi:ATPase subunit of ABC transporter with duplicated ATPase domains